MKSAAVRRKAEEDSDRVGPALRREVAARNAPLLTRCLYGRGDVMQQDL